MGLSRKDARKKAFTLIFQNDSISADEIMHIASLDDEKIEKNEYISTIVYGCEEKKDELDKIISDKIAPGRNIARLSKVVLYILRLAIYEIKYIDDIPVKVSANEAVELAKEFGDEREPKYINGVLSSVIKDIQQ